MAIKFGWCLDDVHDECVGEYTLLIDKVEDKKGRKKVEQVEVEGKCPCECHA